MNCGRTSDSINAADAQERLEQYECKIPSVEAPSAEPGMKTARASTGSPPDDHWSDFQRDANLVEGYVSSSEDSAKDAGIVPLSRKSARYRPRTLF